MCRWFGVCGSGCDRSSITFSIPQNCTGAISHETSVGPRKETVVSATLNIYDGTDVEVWVRIYGFGASMSSRIFNDPFTVEILGDKLFEPKSFALVYVHNGTQTRYPSVHLGQRQLGDHLIKFDSKFIQRTSTTNFPESEFEYSQTDAYLTHISFSFNVRNFLINITWLTYTTNWYFFRFWYSRRRLYCLWTVQISGKIVSMQLYMI